MRLPDFLIIGAARSGTTTLYECLKQHPAIFLPENKRPEPHFFLKAAAYREGIEAYSRRYFADVPNAVVAGEASTSYLYQPWVAARIAQHLPGVKLIALLRDPADRAYSNYLISSANGFDTLTFSQAIRAEAHRLAHPASDMHREVAPFAYVDRGRYYTQLERYLAHFERERLFVGLFDDLASRPGALFADVLRFLGVDESFVPTGLATRHNAAGGTSVAMPPEDRAWIIDNLADEIDALEGWLGRDLSAWRRV